MTFQRWWNDAEQRSARHPWKEYPRRTKTRRSSGTKLLLIAPMLLVLSVAIIYQSNMYVSSNPFAQATIRVSGGSSVNPLVISGPTVFTTPSSIALLPSGSTFSIQIQVANMPQFNGWDIQVVTFPFAVINATSLSITGNDFAVNASSASSFELIHCVNGKGSGCTSTDGPGIVHSALASSGILTGNGLLFTVTYKITSSQPYNRIGLQNDNIGDPNSGNGVPHASMGGAYGAPAIGGGGGTAPRAA